MRTTRSNLRGLATALFACLLLSGCGGDSRVPVELSDRYPSTTAADWVTYADFAAVVEVVDEKSGQPSAEDLERGEGDITRTVTLRVAEVLWQAPDRRQAPVELEYAALGWQFQDGNPKDLQPMVASDRPRLEVGGTYLMAFKWQQEVCYEGDGVIPAHWNGLGSGSVLPYDGKTIGVGEFAGEQRDLDAASEDAKDLPSDALASQAVGKDGKFAAQLLESARPGQAEDYGPAPSTC